MWRKKKARRLRTAKIDTLIGQRTEVHGDVRFLGGLHVDGTIKGNVLSDQDESSLLTLSDSGSIEGEVRVPHVVINGNVIGDVHASRHLELKAMARVTGNVYYRLLEMANGAEVNGNLIHEVDDDIQPVSGTEPEVLPPPGLTHDR
jgi:cytoskeletal protein CcmA (bactofilin family)